MDDDQFSTLYSSISWLVSCLGVQFGTQCIGCQAPFKSLYSGANHLWPYTLQVYFHFPWCSQFQMVALFVVRRQDLCLRRMQQTFWNGPNWALVTHHHKNSSCQQSWRYFIRLWFCQSVLVHNQWAWWQLQEATSLLLFFATIGQVFFNLGACKSICSLPIMCCQVGPFPNVFLSAAQWKLDRMTGAISTI